jgi:hypothetical protein
LQAMQKQMEGPVNALLDAEFAGAMTAAALRARAAELFREAIAQSLDYEYLCIQSRGLARVLLDSDDLDGAAEAARACLSYAARIRSYGYMADAWWVLAEVARERDDAPGALTALAGCLQAEMRQVVRAGSAPHDNVKALSVKALRLASRGADPLTAILIVESGKAIATSVSLIRAVPLQGRRPGPLQELYEERETLRLRSIWEAGGELNAQMAGAEAVIVRARRDLAVRDPRAATWHDATYLDISRPVPVRRLLAELGPRTTYLGFVVDRSRLFAYAVWPEDQILESVEFPSDGIASHDSAKLGSTLLQPLAARLRALAADDRLIISPSPELDAVPFGLLPFDGRPLCIHATISIVNGSGMLEACASRPALALHTAVAVGAPARPDTVELPHAVREVEQIARKMETAGIQVQPLLLGAAATVPALVDRAATADLIHLACHAFAANDEQAARLLLAPAPLANDSGVLSDDRIVSEIDLKAGCHVNLAACRTSIAGGEGAYFANGLVAAFLVGGASSVLATLWPLSDAPAATFQAAYYDHLIAGLSPAFALAATQRAAIRGDLGDELRRPENFGGYVLHGVAATSRNTRTPT